MLDLLFFYGKLLGTYCALKTSQKPFFTSLPQILFPLFVALKKIPCPIFSLVAFLLEWLGDPLFGLLILQLGSLLPSLIGSRASSIHTPPLEFLYQIHTFFQIFATVLCDLIKFARNKAVHEGFIPNISILASSIKRTSLDHATAWQSSSPLVKEYWSPPPTGSHKI